MQPKPAKTAADYLAMAVCPALIMLLVGSLVFFLLQAGYEGEWIGRLRWTLFWFVFAMVLVSRIAIQQSESAALFYGIALAAATYLLVLQYVGFVWIVWILLALIWWAANRMVWDCTLIDDDQDASGKGLLQATGFGRLAAKPRKQVRAVTSDEQSPFFERPRLEPAVPSVGLSGLLGSGRLARESAHLSAGKDKSKKRRTRAPSSTPHSPGLWVLYFSFAAVPIFGLGELFLNSTDEAGRRFSFMLLAIYLFAALALLLLTSFLGLRRYLRQRFIVMPGAIARQWVTTGTALACSVLLLALILPRPAASFSLSTWMHKLSSPDQEASAYAPSTSKGALGRSSTRTPGPDGQFETDQPGDRQDPSGTGATSPNGRGRSLKQGESKDTAPRPLPNLPSLSFRLEKWLSYVVLAVVILFSLYFFRDPIAGWLSSLLKRRTSLKGKERQFQKNTPGPRLLANPFQTGQAANMTAVELVQYSFEGLALWAAARKVALNESETPLEFAERLAQTEPSVANEALLLSGYYSNVAYGNQNPPEDSRLVLQRLWSVIGFAG